MVGGGGLKGIKTAALVLKGTSSSSLTCINVVIFVRVGKMNVKPRFSLMEPPSICLHVSTLFFCFTYILSGDVS